jgi:hypothetical protein
MAHWPMALAWFYGFGFEVMELLLFRRVDDKLRET